VIGNGDITTPEMALEMLRRTGCDAAMIGRASLTNPWIFRQASALLRGQEVCQVNLAERRTLMRLHFDEVVRREDERTALHKLRKFTGWYTHGSPTAAASVATSPMWPPHRSCWAPWRTISPTGSAEVAVLPMTIPSRLDELMPDIPGACSTQRSGWPASASTAS